MFFKYLFYSGYKFRKKLGLEKFDSGYADGSVAGISFLFLGNIVSIYNFLPDVIRKEDLNFINTHPYLGIIFGYPVIFIVFNILFLYKDKYIKIIEETEKLPKQTKTKWLFLVIIYIFLTILIFFISLI